MPSATLVIQTRAAIFIVSTVFSISLVILCHRDTRCPLGAATYYASMFDWDEVGVGSGCQPGAKCLNADTYVPGIFYCLHKCSSSIVKQMVAFQNILREPYGSTDIDYIRIIPALGYYRRKYRS